MEVRGYEPGWAYQWVPLAADDDLGGDPEFIDLLFETIRDYIAETGVMLIPGQARREVGELWVTYAWPILRPMRQHIPRPRGGA